MKILAVFLILASSALADSIVPEIIPAGDDPLKPDIVVNQSTASGRTHVRWTGTHYYSAVQSFTWTDAAPLGGIGVKLFGISGGAYQDQVAFELRIFPLSAIGSGSVVDPALASYSFMLSGEASKFRGNYLYFTLPEPLKLQENAAYLFEITPMYTNDALLSLATSNNEDAYPAGSGAVYPSTTTEPPTKLAGTLIGDFVFFLTKAATP